MYGLTPQSFLFPPRSYLYLGPTPITLTQPCTKGNQLNSKPSVLHVLWFILHFMAGRGWYQLFPPCEKILPTVEHKPHRCSLKLLCRQYHISITSGHWPLLHTYCLPRVLRVQAISTVLREVQGGLRLKALEILILTWGLKYVHYGSPLRRLWERVKKHCFMQKSFAATFEFFFFFTYHITL